MEYRTLVKVLGENIRNYREQTNLTQASLAEKTGYTINYISLLENGHRGVTLDGLCKFAKVLKVEPNILLTKNSRNNP